MHPFTLSEIKVSAHTKMFVIASTQKPSVVPSIRRIRREVESKRIEKLKKIHEDAKRIAREEVQFFKDLFQAPEDEEKNNDTQ